MYLILIMLYNSTNAFNGDYLVQTSRQFLNCNGHLTAMVWFNNVMRFLADFALQLLENDFV